MNDGKCQFGQPSSVVEIDGNELNLLRAGVVSESNLGRLASMLVLLVCTGNTCRSPMAEVLCRNLISKKLNCEMDALEDHGVMVMSAGVAAMPGGRPSPEAVEVMATLDLVLDGHVAQPLSERLANYADVIFTMTNSHREAIVRQWPHLASNVQVLRVDNGDVSDPIGGSLEVYEACARQIQGELEQRIAKLDLPQPK